MQQDKKVEGGGDGGREIRGRDREGGRGIIIHRRRRWNNVCDITNIGLCDSLSPLLLILHKSKRNANLFFLLKSS